MATTAATFDPGLQPERTALSWTRTSVAILLNGLLVTGRDLVVEPGRWHPATGIVALLALTAAVAVWLTGRTRTRTLSRRPIDEQVRAPRAVMATGLAVMTLCVVLPGAAVLRTG